MEREAVGVKIKERTPQRRHKRIEHGTVELKPESIQTGNHPNGSSVTTWFRKTGIGESLQDVADSAGPALPKTRSSR